MAGKQNHFYLDFKNITAEPFLFNFNLTEAHFYKNVAMTKLREKVSQHQLGNRFK